MTRACLDPGWRGGLAGGAGLLGIGWQLQQAETLPVVWSVGLLLLALLLLALAAPQRQAAAGLATGLGAAAAPLQGALHGQQADGAHGGRNEHADDGGLQKHGE